MSRELHIADADDVQVPGDGGLRRKPFRSVTRTIGGEAIAHFVDDTLEKAILDSIAGIAVRRVVTRRFKPPIQQGRLKVRHKAAGAAIAR